MLIIVTDDQRAGGTMDVLPQTRRLIGRRGITFTRAFASNPLCCPARATIMTGQYAHNHGVVDNHSTFELDVGHTLQSALGEAGYHTSIFGKYLNQWIDSPPVFDDWLTFRPSDPAGYKNLEYNDSGRVRSIQGYATDVLKRAAVDQLKANEKRDSRPWLLFVTPNAPHAPYTPPARYSDAAVDPWEGNPAVTELDRTDKPSYVQNSTAHPANIAEVRTKQLRALMAVDDLVGKLDKVMKNLKERPNTLVFFISDNGFSWGEHGLLGAGRSKNHPYSSSIRVPLLMRWPKEISPRESRKLVTNVDLAPTVYAATGVNPPTRMDGRSLISGSWSRRFVFLEHEVNLDQPQIPQWLSIRSGRSQYVEYLDDQGEVAYREYYDLEADPWQLENLLGDGIDENDPDYSGEHHLVTRLSTCKGTGGSNPCP